MMPPVLRTGGIILSKKPEEKHVIANQRRNAGVALSKDSLRSQSVLPPWLPLWGSCHEVTERVQIALSALTGHLSHRERQVSLIRPLRRAPSPRGRLWGTDCDQREFPGHSGNRLELVGADALIGPMGNVLKHEWVDVGIDPYGFLRRFSKPESILCPHPSRLRRDTYTLLCNCHWQSLDFDSLRGAPPPREGLEERIATPLKRTGSQ